MVQIPLKFIHIYPPLPSYKKDISLIPPSRTTAVGPSRDFPQVVAPLPACVSKPLCPCSTAGSTPPALDRRRRPPSLSACSRSTPPAPDQRRLVRLCPLCPCPVAPRSTPSRSRSSCCSRSTPNCSKSSCWSQIDALLVPDRR